MKNYRLWDLPVRLFHWLLVLCVFGAIGSGFVGGNLMPLHGKLGIATAGLLVFRVVWGFVGSTHARFASFVRGPQAIADYLQGRWQGLGHNPAGALSVLGMLTVLAFQVLTGLFSYDDIAFRGPYAFLLPDERQTGMTGLHKSNAWLVFILIAVHLSAIVYYVRFKGDNLVKPMLTGMKEIDAAHATPPARGGSGLALVVALALAVAAAWAAAGGLASPPAEVPAAQTPNW